MKLYRAAPKWNTGRNGASRKTWTVLRRLKEEKRVTKTLVRYHGMEELEGQY